ncbi:ABC transporter permease [Nocardioides sp. GY 10127]|nr:ABC transporter permease [Nocardioides sp. GY 10127]
MLLLTSVVVFLLQALAPGDPVQNLLPVGQPPTKATLAAIRAEYGLDKSLPAQYVSWLTGALHLDFGNSITYGTNAGGVVAGRAVMTLELAALALVLSLGIGIPLGVWIARRHRSLADRLSLGGVLLVTSTPAFVSALGLTYVFSYKIPIFPASGVGEGFGDRLVHLVLPAVALAAPTLGLLVKISRTSVVDTLAKDYVAAARMRGVPERRTTWNYAVRNAMIPILTSAGIVTGYVITGTVLVETVFSLPGLGTLLVSAAENQDIPVLQCLAVVFAAAILLVNLLTDVLYAVVDPRVTLR